MGGGFTPRGGTGATPAEVWGYVARLLTITPEIEADALVRYNALVAAIGGILTAADMDPWLTFLILPRR